jgi:serine/threonine-protein kinase HipA
MEELNEMAKRLVLSRVSVPGVQAKLSVHLERAAETPDRLTLVGLDGNYILKLPTRSYPELPESEHFAMTLARLCGIETAAFGLFRLESGALAYLTRRMDREDGMKHMLDFCQLTDRRTSRKYYGSHEQIARAIRRFSSDGGSDIVRFFEVLLFSFLIGNSDMHLKNFSLLREHDGSWHLSSAYDLVPVRTVLPTDLDDLALTVNGKNRNLRASDFRAAAATMGLTPVQYRRLSGRMAENVRQNLDEAIDRSFLSEQFVARFRNLVADTLARLSSD